MTCDTHTHIWTTRWRWGFNTWLCGAEESPAQEPRAAASIPSLSSLICCAVKVGRGDKRACTCVFACARRGAAEESGRSATVQVALKHGATRENQNRDSWSHTRRERRGRVGTHKRRPRGKTDEVR